MSALCGCFLASVTMCVTVVSSWLLAPRNVQLTSYNMDLTLKWSSPENETCETLYSTRFWSRSQSEPRAACVNTTALLCHLSDPSLGLFIFEFGSYHASVRAQCGAELSEWVDSQAITMDRDTVIGAPNVSFVANGADLEVMVRDPQFSISTMTGVFGQPQYNISFWPRQRPNMAVHVVVQQNRAVLDDLEPQTEYCVQVRVRVDPVRNHNPGDASEPVCARTKNKPSAPWLVAVLTFFALVLVVALVVISVVYHKRIFHFLCPKDPLPQSLLQLPECPHSPCHLMPQTETYHPLNEVPGPCTEESIILTSDLATSR